MTKNKIEVVVGPTASGKSAHALSIPNAVVINCDAMQSYDALHYLTAQPDEEERSDVPHRLYGFLHPNAHYSAADWRLDAIREIDAAFHNGMTPVLCGGTGFYLKSLMEGLSPIPEIPNEARQEAMTLQAEMGNPEFHRLLNEKDPETASRLDPMNTQRLVRAWEVLTHTGTPLSTWQDMPLIPPPADYDFHVTAILPSREILYANINARTYKMLDQGILDEVKALDSRIQNGEVNEDALVTKAHGFKTFRNHLRWKETLDEAINKTQTEGRQYAKRQMTWLRNQIDIDVTIETV